MENYRKLGVERFVFLDDQSTDGTRQFLSAQLDCMVLRSYRNFSEIVPINHPMAREDGKARIVNIWLNILIRKFSLNRWANHLDADEFLKLPVGMRIQDLLRSTAQDARFIWSVVLEMYPSTISSPEELQNSKFTNMDDDWYYDAREYLRLVDDGELKRIYPGARARLMAKYNVQKHTGWKLLRSKWKTPQYGRVRKPIIIRIPESGYLKNAHFSMFSGASKFLLPLEHYKFSGQVFQRTQSAIEQNSHFDNSIQYKD